MDAPDCPQLPRIIRGVVRTHFHNHSSAIVDSTAARLAHQFSASCHTCRARLRWLTVAFLSAVTSCALAGICTSPQSPDIIVSSPLSRAASGSPDQEQMTPPLYASSFNEPLVEVGALRDGLGRPRMPHHTGLVSQFFNGLLTSPRGLAKYRGIQPQP